jgi:nucleotide-binding universal stress UspA family protein
MLKVTVVHRRRSIAKPTRLACRMKIVVGYDGSDAAKRALESAASLGGDQARIVVVAVAVAEPYPRSGITIPANLDPVENRQRRHDLDEARQFLSERGIEAETMQARGKPADVLVEAARDADLAIVGSRGLNRLQRLIVGSVSSKLVHRAACDVLIVR